MNAPDNNPALHLVNGGRGCRGCGACAEICPTGALSMRTDRFGFPVPALNPAACVGCGRCRSACQFNPECFAPERREPEFFAGRLADAKLLDLSSSGGAFRAFSEAALGGGGAVAGVVFDREFRAVLDVADDRETRDRMLTSKYVAAVNQGGVYSRCRQLLRAGRRVFFCGTPCQIAGLYGFLGADHELLLTADFVCHGVPAPKVFAACLRERTRGHGGPAGVNFRFKGDGAGWTPMYLKIVSADGGIYMANHEHDEYFRFFLAGGLNRSECASCPFTRVKGRPGDVSFCDAWRAGKLDSRWRDNRGISGILVNSAKGKTALGAISGLELAGCDLATLDQGYLHRPGKPHPDRAAFFRRFERAEAAGRVLGLLDSYAVDPRPLRRRLASRLKKIIRSMCGKSNGEYGDKP